MSKLLHQREELFRTLGPAVQRLREFFEARNYLANLLPDRLKLARDLAKHELFHQSGYCLDDRNRSDNIDNWTLDWMREVVLAADTLEKCETGKVVIRTLKISEPDISVVSVATQSPRDLKVDAPTECLEPEEADAIG